MALLSAELLIGRDDNLNPWAASDWVERIIGFEHEGIKVALDNSVVKTCLNATSFASGTKVRPA